MPSTPLIALDSPTAVDGRHIRAVTFQRVRMEYVTGLLDRHGITPAGGHALVIGGGRGPLAAGLARLGFVVTAVDPSPDATAMAREAHESAGLAAAIDTRTAPPTDLGVPAAEFDLVYAADTFEVTADLDGAVAEAARALRPGGVLAYDTVNRTPVARLLYLGAFQRLGSTRIMPPGRYAAERLRTPAEMAAALIRHGIEPGDVTAFKPRQVRSLVTATRARRRGEITDAELPELVDMVAVPDGKPVVTYLGHGTAQR
ncbi:methyltransferase domain-containing protein [Streptomyces sp. A7024]|uniref:Methyltransferase domain-containing protein n=1 Tax=Streptomyces coryli TaxID=1128680 RepID=A0A6G4U4I4_9ACTN|nr:methyltransferase domain-containing protein [Streptomyces coryli]NGN66650.1 methyltransferase domain-containing protein [Streptomyces coryli]